LKDARRSVLNKRFARRNGSRLRSENGQQPGLMTSAVQYYTYNTTSLHTARASFAMSRRTTASKSTSPVCTRSRARTLHAVLIITIRWAALGFKKRSYHGANSNTEKTIHRRGSSAWRRDASLGLTDAQRIEIPIML